MSILTWRDVSAPNTAGAAEVVGNNGQRTAQALFDMAMGLGQFGQARTDRADAAAIQAASQITDPDAYARALQEGSILRSAGIDPNMISGKAAEALANRQGTLLSNAATKQITASSVLRDRLFEENQADNLLTTALGRKKTGVDIEQNRFNLKQDKYLQGLTERSDVRQEDLYQMNQQAAQVLQQLNNSGLPLVEQRAWVRQQGFHPYLEGILNQSKGWKDTPLPGVMTPGGEFRLDDLGGDTVVGNADLRQFGHNKPVTQSTLSELAAVSKPLIQSNKGKFGDPETGSSAMGTWQFTEPTRRYVASKLYGDDWGNKVFDNATQREMALDLIQNNKGGNLKARFDSLPHAEPGYYKDWSNEDLLIEIAKGESGTQLTKAARPIDDRPPQTILEMQTEASQFDRATKASIERMRAANVEANSGIDPQAYLKAGSDTRDTSVLAQEAIKANPSLAGKGWLTDDADTVAKVAEQIESLVKDSNGKIKPAQAALLLPRILSPTTGIGGFAEDLYKTNISDDWVVDTAKRKQMLADIDQNRILGQSSINREDEAAIGSLSALQQNYNNAVAVIGQIATAQQNGDPVDRGYAQKARANFEKARTAFQGALTARMTAPTETKKENKPEEKGLWDSFLEGREKRRAKYEVGRLENERGQARMIDTLLNNPTIGGGVPTTDLARYQQQLGGTREPAAPKPTESWEAYGGSPEAEARRKVQRVSEFKLRNQLVREARDARQREQILADRAAEVRREAERSANAATYIQRQRQEAEEIAAKRAKEARIQQLLDRFRSQ